MSSEEGRALYKSSKVVVIYFSFISLFFVGVSFYFGVTGEIFFSFVFGLVSIMCLSMIVVGRNTIKSLQRKQPDLKGDH